MSSMQHVSVDSSHVQSVAYDEGTELFEVKFKDGAVYRYSHVPYEMWQDLHATIIKHESIGHWLHANIRALPTRYPYVRVEPPAQEQSDAETLNKETDYE